MKLLKLAAALCFVFVSSGLTWADSIPLNDPQIILRGGIGSIPMLQTTLGFSVTATSQDPSPTLVIQNQTGLTFFDLLVSSAIGGLTCEVQAFFTNCAPSADGTSVLFFGTNGTTLNGIPTAVSECFEGPCEEGFVGGEFALQFIGLPLNQATDFALRANIPEPSTILLLLGGAGAFLVLRKRRLIGQLNV